MLEEASRTSDVLENYQPYYAAKADLLVRCENFAEASKSYKRAIDLSENLSERQFLQSKLDQIERRPNSD